MGKFHSSKTKFYTDNIRAFLKNSMSVVVSAYRDFPLIYIVVFRPSCYISPFLSSCSGPHVSSDHFASVFTAVVFTSSVLCLLVCSPCLLPLDLLLILLTHSPAPFPLIPGQLFHCSTVKLVQINTLRTTNVFS